MRLALALVLIGIALALLFVRTGSRAAPLPAPATSGAARTAPGALSPPPQREEAPRPAREEVPTDAGLAAAPAVPDDAPPLVLEGRVLMAVPGAWANGEEPRLPPLAGALVRARWSDGFERGTLGSAVADGDGRWRLAVESSALPPVRLTIEAIAEAPGRATMLEASPLPDDPTTVLAFVHVLPALPQPGGRVLLESGAPAAFASVMLYGGVPHDGTNEPIPGARWQGLLSPFTAHVLADEDGSYAFPGAGEIDSRGTYLLSARRGELAAGCELPAGLAVLPSRLPDLVLRAPPVALEGRVLAADGVPLPGVRVEARALPLVPDLDPAAIPAVWTDAEGRFHFRGLEEGPRELRVPWDPLRVEAGTGSADLTLRLATLCAVVTLVDAQGRTLRAPVQAFAHHHDGPRDALGTLRTTQNEAGCAVFPLRPGVSAIELVAGSPPDGQVRRLLAASGRTQTVRLVVPAAAR